MRSIIIKVFSEATGKEFKKITVKPAPPMEWDFSEDEYVSAIKKALSYFVGKTVFFTDKNTADDFYEMQLNSRQIYPLDDLLKASRATYGDGVTFTLMCANKNKDTDPVCMSVFYSDK